MKTTYLRNLLTAVVCLFAGVSAQAQLTATYEAYPAADWGNEKAVTFSLTAVANALETDTVTLVKALDSWTAEGSEDANMFFLTTTDGLSDNYTQGGKGGFWVNADGVPQAWSGDNSGLRWFNMIGWDAPEDAFQIIIGQFPGQCKAGDTFKPQFVLKMGEKQATLEVTINIIEKPEVNIPKPELAWAKLTIVDEVVQDVKQKPRTDYNADVVEVNLTEALAKLGIADASLVQNELKQLLFAKEAYMTDDSAIGAQMSDSLTNQSSANGIGFWMRNVSDAEGNPTFECARFGYDGDDSFYAESFAFDAETGILSCNLGQMPNKLVGGNTYYADLYIVYGEKAIKIRYNLIIEEVKLGTLEDYEKAGESTMLVEMQPMESYDTKNFSIDIETICTALGCQVGEIADFYMLSSDIDFGNKNQEGVGYWVSGDGSIINWGESAMFYVTPKADDFSRFGIGQYPGHMNVGDSIRASLYFLGNGKYYQLNIDLKIIEPKQVDSEFQSVAQRNIEVQQVPVDYEWTSGIDIPAAWVEEQIGTSDWVLYALATLNEDGTQKEGNAKYSKSYTCTPYPGFWMDGEGHNVGWNQTPTRVGITIASPEGKFSLMQHPGCALGDVYKFPIFLVNEENGKMVTFNFTYSVVESVEEIEVVGTEDIMVPLTAEGKSITLDIKKAADALGTTVDNLADGKVLRGMAADGSYSGANNFFDGLTFDLQGNCATDADGGAFYFDMEINEDGQTAKLTAYCPEGVADDFSVIGLFCIQVENKQYAYNAKFVSDTIYTGIETVSVADKKDNRIYDLQGREVKNAKRGLYIVNGRKFVK